jgi:predicted peptidase
MKDWRSMVIVSALLALVGCSSPAKTINAKAPLGTGMSVQQLKMADGSTRNVSVFLPFSYDGKREYPAIVFLQGLGEGGTDGVKNTTVGLGPAIAKRPATFPFIAVFPQSGGPWGSSGAQKMAIDVLDAAQAKYKIDRNRVYLTGLSTGGFGTWEIGAKHPDRFAALVPCCAYSGEDFAPQLTKMPIWAFHNGADPFVFSSSTKDTVKKINKLGGNAKMTIYGAFGHDCWGRAYDEPELWTWLAQQHK